MLRTWWVPTSTAPMTMMAMKRFRIIDLRMLMISVVLKGCQARTGRVLLRYDGMIRPKSEDVLKGM